MVHLATKSTEPGFCRVFSSCLFGPTFAGSIVIVSGYLLLKIKKSLLKGTNSLERASSLATLAKLGNFRRLNTHSFLMRRIHYRTLLITSQFVYWFFTCNEPTKV